MKYQLKYIFFIHLFILSGGMVAQDIISLDKAIEIAMDNNAKLRSEGMMVKYHTMLVNTAYNYDPTQINAELGQFNSSFFDTGFGISQSFNLPQVYRRRAEANKQNAKTSAYNLSMSEAEIRQQLDELFMEYNYLSAKEKLLTHQDSLFTSFVEKSNFRYQNGETDALEKATAEQQKITIQNQLSSVRKMKEYLGLEVDWLLNDGKRYKPETNVFSILKYGIFYDSLSVQKHPAIQMAQQEILAARSITHAERAALLPSVSAGYRNVSIRGTGADNIQYQGADRFNSFQVGVGIPIFKKGIKSSIQSAQVMEDVKALAYASKKDEIISKITQKYLLYNEANLQLLQYENKALPNLRLIRTVSEKQFANGQINYLDFVMLTNQAIAIESEYLALKRNLNSYIIELHYLTTNY